MVSLRVNGETYQQEVEPRKLLVHFLRDDLKFKGTRIGCVVGKCGACTVLMNGTLVKSCLIFAAQANNSDILTIEGLIGDSRFSRIQESFSEAHGLQCGYCTSGMVVSSYGLLSKNPAPTEQEIRRHLAGNLCMCTGYINIIKAIMGASRKQDQEP